MTNYLTRFSDEMCPTHRTLFGYAAADSLDSSDVDLRAAFERYAARCANGDGCEL